MSAFEAFDSGVQVRGAAVQSIIAGVPDAFTTKARNILADNGIEDTQPEEWYPQQAYLDAYRTIVEQIGSSTLRQIGEATPKHAEWPPGIDDPLAALQSIDDAYHMNHRGGDIGYYETEPAGDSSVDLRCRTPYPCEYDRALAKGTAMEFTDSYVTVEETSDRCRSDGGRECMYRVSW